MWWFLVFRICPQLAPPKVTPAATEESLRTCPALEDVARVAGRDVFFGAKWMDSLVLDFFACGDVCTNEHVYL